MADSKYFGIPFGTSGDKATIPEAVQPGGAISYTQGFGPDYERDPATDPLAKRVPRDETNEFYFQTSNAIKYLQLYGAPEWYALDDSGNPVSYPLTARVRHLVGGVMRNYRSLVASNITEPGTDATKWALDEAFSFTALEATLAELNAGTSAAKVITPRRLADGYQRQPWAYANAAGTLTAATATLVPAPAALVAGLRAVVRFTTPNTGPATLNVNGLGAAGIVNKFGGPLIGGELIGPVEFTYDGALWWADVVVPALDANRVYYVNAATGNDNNSGRAPGTAFATIQKAVDVVAAIDRQGFNLDISVANGSYAGFATKELSGSGNTRVIGNVATPASVVVTGAAGPAIAVAHSGWFFEGFRPVSAVVAGAHNFQVDTATTAIGSMEWPINPGPASNGGAHIAVGGGGSLTISGTQRIIGGATIAHMYATTGSTIRASNVNPALNVAVASGFGTFVLASTGSVIALTYSGITNPANVTNGTKFNVSSNSVINTNGAGINYFPGPAPGVTNTGGQYV